MNKEEIDKWLDEEYGCSYTRLEELHNYYFEKYTDQKEEIEKLNNIIDELEKYFEEEQIRLARETSNIYEDSLGKTRLVNDDIFNEITRIKDKLKELKEGKE